MRNELNIIKWGAIAIIVLAAIAWVSWSWFILGYVQNMLFTDGFWHRRWNVENHAEITPTAWWSFLGLIGIGYTLGTACFFAGIRMLSLHARAELFTPKTVNAIFTLGLIIVITMLWDTVWGALDHAIITSVNTNSAQMLADGSISRARPYMPPSYDYDSGDIALILCGLGFCIIGYILRVAQKIDAENKEFV